MHHIGLALNGILERITMDFAIMQKGEPMSDLIDRQKVINAIANTECHISTSEWNELVDAIINLPPAENRGRWTLVYIYQCSECGTYHRAEHNYCPNCGARMENGE